MTSTKWKFNESVTAQFEQMLKRSIPQYQVMRELGHRIHSQTKSLKTLDLGSSRGDSIRMMTNDFTNFTCTEISPPMLGVLNKRYGKDDHVEILECDLRHDFPEDNFDYVQSILTLMFIPIEYRYSLLRKIYDALPQSGVFILVEKVLGASAPLDKVFTQIYYDFKGGNNYSEDEIERKKQQLEGVLVPVTASWNEDMLIQTGFREVDCFWRWSNFAGWIAKK